MENPRLSGRGFSFFSVEKGELLKKFKIPRNAMSSQEIFRESLTRKVLRNNCVAN